MHVHGHDFYVLGTGAGVFGDTSTLKFNNPPRRDVAMLPADGWLVLAFETNNPGAWLMHCHIVSHLHPRFYSHAGFYSNSRKNSHGTSARD